MRRKCGRPPVILMVLCGAAAVFLFSAIVMLLWNAVLPDVLPVRPVNYWQAMGILVLSKILFSGFGGGGRKKFGSRGELRDKYRNMGEEERQKFREAWKRRCGMHS
ncbi:hypothetical protein [Niabella hibiscisoli]|uniref:hypothetical protein n=1 Tax=Niabella hibiscisoli TaxID=1825928 RepID=UPI001F0E4C30|nr:hypothetical protein [Niabella hibiscisoli]MCH5715128.1 hypothetical protein [Niabella hibiscisoli]